MSVAFGFFLCFAATIVVIIGDYFLKTAADRSLPLTSPQFLVGCFLYGLSGLGWFLAMQKISLSQIGVAFSMISLLALCVMGVVSFGEKLYLREYIGIALAIVSMGLMARFY